MSVVIFAGPTIPESSIREIIDAVVLPPACMGDVYRAAGQQPAAIGIIDGYFDGVPSVWHKEILWALDHNIPVFGAASMGALRAAELQPFGMIGAGRIFEAYRDGELEDDDEVAVHHGPAEMGYIPLSEPMVNIRATLAGAVETKVIDQALADVLVRTAKDMAYPDRNWDRLLKDGSAQKRGTISLEALQAWLPGGRIDQKHQDAVAMLAAIKDHLRNEDEWIRPAFDFEWTVMWDQLVRRSADQPQSLNTKLILDQLRRNPEKYQQIRLRAASSVFASRPASPGRDIDTSELKRAITRFRAERGLFSKRALDAWLAENDLDVHGLEEFIADKVRLEADIAASIGEIRKRMLEELECDERYAELAGEAEQIARVLQGFGSGSPDPGDLGLSTTQLVLWYFEKLLEIPVPDDLEAFVKTNDFFNRTEFDQMMVRQYIWFQHTLEKSQ